MKKKKVLFGGIAIALSAIMFSRTVPMEIWNAMAEEIKEALSSEETVETDETVSANTLTDENNLNGYILEEDVSKRTRTTKEYVMSDETRMIQQFAAPVHEYINGEYKEIDDSVAEKGTANNGKISTENVPLQPFKSAFSYVSVSENGKTEINGDELHVGKKDDGAKQEVFLRVNTPNVDPSYALVGVGVQIGYANEKQELLSGNIMTCELYVADSEIPLSEITCENKPTKLQTLERKTEETLSKQPMGVYESENINISHIKDGALTIGITALSDDGYVDIAAAASTTSVTYTYKHILGVESGYSTETFEINGATAYVNNATGLLTVVSDLASVETLSDMPFAASLVYNKNYNEIFEDFGISAMFGNHTKLNYQQYIKRSAAGAYYEWIDADGTVTTLNRNLLVGYYSATKNVYFEEDSNNNGKLYDAQGNELYFTNGRLTEITNDKAGSAYYEGITITYENILSDNITQITYTNGLYGTSYNIKFTYATLNGVSRATSVKTYAGTTLQSSYTLTYANGNLTKITNATAGVDVLKFEYSTENVVNGIDTNGELRMIFNYEKDGLGTSLRDDGTTMEITYITGTQMLGMQFLEYDRAEFNMDNTLNTIISYYHAGLLVREKHVAYNNEKRTVSEWVIDEYDEVTVYNTLNWTVRSAYNAPYTQEKVTYVEPSTVKQKTEYLLMPSNIVSYTVGSSDLGVTENNAAYKYVVSFKVQSITGIDLAVQLGNTTERVKLDYSRETYVSISVGYVSSGTLKIANMDTNYHIQISNICYAVVDYTSITDNNKGVTQTEVYSSSGRYVNTTYKDNKATEMKTKLVNGDETKTTYTYSTASDWTKGKLLSTSTTGAESANTQYTYGKNGTTVTQTCTATQGNITMRSQSTLARTNTTATLTQTDENNTETVYNYEFLAGDMRLKSYKSGNMREEYEYNALGQVKDINVYNVTNGTTVYSQSNHYNGGLYTGSTYGGDTYTYTYGTNAQAGLVQSIKQGNTAMISYAYDTTKNGANALQQKTYANGHTASYATSYTTGKYNTKISYQDGASDTTVAEYKYNLDEKGNVKSQEYRKTNSQSFYNLRYDYENVTSDTPCLTIGGLKYHTEYTATYNARTGLLEKTSIDSATSCSDWDTWDQTYEYDEKGRLTATSFGSHDTAYTYDDAGRVTGYVLANYNSPIVDNTYIYGTNGNYATNRLVEIKNNNYKNVGSTYAYNAQGYVTGYTTDRNWYNDYTYTYDTLGRLTSETYNGETFTYTYDNKNNVQKTGLTYTNGKLTSVDGKAIVYDAMGNPTTYKGKAFTWTQGRKLAAGSMNGNTFTYEYDGNGMRYEKTVNGKKTEYYWNGSQLLYEYRQDLNERIYYIYDASGIAGILYNNDVYYFAKNAFGDIVAIFNESGQQVAEYVYDAWGNVIYENYDNSDNIGEINPFRYRGYYYDTETGFYYLQTRYYDPTICRFINADNYELVGELSMVVGQLNLYTYSGNNPIIQFNNYIATSQVSTSVSVEISCAVEIPSATMNTSTSSNWDYQWFDTDWPNFLVVSKEGFEVISWDLSIFKISSYTDYTHTNSAYLGIGNVDAYIGYNYQKGLGFDVGASAFELGYNGDIIDINISVLTIGATYIYKGGKLQWGVKTGWFGFNISLDLVKLNKLLS
ncbi:MAG: hypothetical protein IJA89_07445 [Clostridia bacterium]|nr:hypothetical protein [Clostridia bacterium]